MKKLLVSFLTASMVIFSFCTRPCPDSQEIIEVIDYSYIDGIHNLKGSEVIRQGFWNDFEMLMFNNNQIEKLHLEDWISRVESQIEEGPVPPENLASARYLDIDITGNAAVAGLELYREDQKLFTDYFTLYKFDDGWKIAGKIFYRH